MLHNLLILTFINFNHIRCTNTLQSCLPIATRLVSMLPAIHMMCLNITCTRRRFVGVLTRLVICLELGARSCWNFFKEVSASLSGETVPKGEMRGKGFRRLYLVAVEGWIGEEGKPLFTLEAGLEDDGAKADQSLSGPSSSRHLNERS